MLAVEPFWPSLRVEPKHYTLKLFLICSWLSAYGSLWFWQNFLRRWNQTLMRGCLRSLTWKKGAVSKQVWPPYNPQSFWTGLDLMCWAHLTAHWRENAPCPNAKTLYILLFSGKNKLSLFPSFGSQCKGRKVLYRLSLRQLEKMCTDVF